MDSNLVLLSTIAALTGDPWHLPLSEIAKLTDRQIQRIYFHPRDEEGRVVVPKPTLPDRDPTPEEEDAQMAAIMRAFGASKQAIANFLKEAHERRIQRANASSSVRESSDPVRSEATDANAS